jgi:hypothetical protein
MVPHAHERYRAQMGHQWLGFAPAQVTRWLEDAGFGAVRVVPLPVAAGATGPGVFVGGGVRGG